MKITALIAEFNPFHNGHKYILDEIKKSSDGVVVIMSGNAVQRGDIAITDKHTRTRIALQNGADLVIELPAIYAVNTAQKFAYGAISTLNATGIVSHLAFGSESGSIDELINAVKILENEPTEVSERIKQFVSDGMSYPAAREKAYSGIIAPEILSKPNNILALEYLRAIIYTNSTIKPFTITRTNDFHSTDTSSEIISATAVRNLIENGKDASGFVPESDFDVYSISALDNTLTYLLRTVSSDYLAKINDVGEGLENRIIEAAKHNTGFNSIAQAIKSKRYTMSRIRRVLFSALTGLTKDICTLPPSYIRILGMNDTGKSILKEMKSHSTLPVITKTADFTADEIFKAEIRITEAAAICKKNGTADSMRDYKISPVII